MSSSTDAQRELEQTRARMSAELDALAYKLDVPARAKDRVSSATARARRAAPSGADVQRTAEQNPFGAVLGGLAVGVLAGLLLPRTRVEDEQLGPIADRARDEAAAAGREALQRGKSVGRRAAEAAKETAGQAGQQQAAALRETARSRASDVANAANQ